LEVVCFGIQIQEFFEELYIIARYGIFHTLACISEKLIKCVWKYHQRYIFGQGSPC